MICEDLKDKVVIVTGGGKGIGKVYVREFAKQGSKVVAADIDYEAAQRVAEEFSALGGEILAIEVDVSDWDSVSRMVDATVKAFGGVDVLVNNASLMSALPRRAWDQIPIEEWDRVMAVNVRGPFLCCLAAVPFMKRRGKGKIINISSSRVHEGTPNRLHYTTSKAAIIGFTRALARELGDCNIGVNAITPGLTVSDSQVATSNPEYLQARIANRCFKREQVPEDLVGTVLFLASSASDFITGQTINVDGGRAMH